MQLLGEKLRYLRRQRGMTQVELAQLLSLRSYTHITKIEASQRAASLSLIVRLANALGVTSDYLLRDSIPLDHGVAQAASTGASYSLAEVGKRVRTARLQAGITQVEMARRLGLARQAYVSNIEAGRKEPSPELMVQIADLFGVTTDSLLRPNVDPDGGSFSLDAELP